MKRVAIACVAASISMSPCLPTLAQEPASDPPTATEPAGPTTGYYDETGNWIPPRRNQAPDTNHCPQETAPPEPVSTSERAAAQPLPLPVVYRGPCGVSATAGYEVPEGVVASAWLVADLDSGDVVAMKDPHGRYRPASIVKVLIALVAIEELNLDAKVEVTAESAGQEGSAAGIGEGGDYTVRDLLHGLILNSGNDCAHALAQALGGDDAALEKVNALAAELGMQDTRAASYSGLDAPGMSTSAWDMGLAYKAAFTNPVFSDIADTEAYDFPGFGDLPGFKLWNDNHLYLYDPDGIGGKTGYTDDANHTFVGAVNHEGRRLVAVVLDTTAWDHRPWQQAQMLLHAAYGVGDSVASLKPVAAPTTASATTAAPTPTPQTPVPDGGTYPAPVEFKRHSLGVPIAAIVGVLAMASLALWLSMRHRPRGRHHR